MNQFVEVNTAEYEGNPVVAIRMGGQTAIFPPEQAKVIGEALTSAAQAIELSQFNSETEQ